MAINGSTMVHMYNRMTGICIIWEALVASGCPFHLTIALRQPDQQASAPGYSFLDLSLKMCSRAVNVAFLCSSCIQYSCKGALCPVLHVGWAQCDMKTSLFKHV